MAKTETTPMMKQYKEAKKQHPDEMLFFRMGDFYEMFFDDAREAADLLGIALTSRNKGTDPIPMAGIPVKTVKTYIRRLLEAGRRVAICEQVEDPASAKGIVRREVVKVVTPGTLVDEEIIDENRQLYLLAVSPGKKRSGMAWVDLSTGEFSVFETDDQRLLDAEIQRIDPEECVVPEELLRNGSHPSVRAMKENGFTLTGFPDWNFSSDAAERQLTEHFDVATLEGFGIAYAGPAVEAAGALLRYLYETQKHELKHINAVKVHTTGTCMQIDGRTRKALEIVANAEGRREGTLLLQLDRTATAMGARCLRSWLLSPSAEREVIEARLDAVEELSETTGLCSRLEEELKHIHDIERLAGRLALGSAHGRDVASLGASLSFLPSIRQLLADARSSLIQELLGEITDFSPLCERIRTTLVDSPPLTVREGGLIRDGVSEELDNLHSIAEEGGAWLETFQREQIERTGIPTLKVGYHRVFGYYIEVTHAQTEKVPADYVRKQTLKNAERYITPALKEYETKVLTAHDRSKEIEYELFIRLRDEVAQYIPALQRAAASLAALDALRSFAASAQLHNYVRPVFTDEKVLSIKDGRHPVLEANTGDEAFVPNDVVMDEEHPVSIITGPNMAGKSTYIRQTAVLVLMAQVGSFVPAGEAKIGLVDRLFARVGAADDLYHGQSTFMVEMIETANILNNATEHSLIILDEVGRGTSTFDGISIAWAVTEYIFEKLKARTLFATHYHELTELSLLHSGIRNLNVSVKEYRDRIIFLRKIIEGSTDKSYGIHVARLAALPAKVLERAREILTNLECQSVSPNNFPSFAPPKKKPQYEQRDFFSLRRDEFMEKLKAMDLDNTTPVEALQFLMELKETMP